MTRFAPYLLHSLILGIAVILAPIAACADQASEVAVNRAEVLGFRWSAGAGDEG